MRLLPICALALGCTPKGAPVEAATAAAAPAATWFDVEPGKAVCLSGFPEVPLPTRRDAEAFGAVVASLEAGRPDEAAARLEGLPPDHPAVQGARAVLGLVQGELDGPVATLQGLASSHPDDTCLLTTTCLAVWATGEFAPATDLLLAARSKAPGDGHIAFLSWFLGIEEASALLGPLEAGVAAEPDDLGLQMALGAVHLEQGDPAGAVGPLEVAREGGMLDAEGPLLQAYYLAGQLGPYLASASRLGLPLGDAGALGTAADPLSAFHELLGIGDGQQLEAVFHTSMGDLVCALLPESAPVTVANFVGLARGTQPWFDPRTGAERTTPLYSGTVFHRVIPEFMIQGGDPLGQGVGDPGYTFMDEVDTELSFDRPGVLAMANKGPHTNGSQFFVTEAPAVHLDGRHTIFGTCDDAAVEVVRAIARVPADDRDVPIEPVVLERIEIRISPGAGG